MKFIVDAQLPKSPSDFLNKAGFDSIHTLELADMNRTTDNTITAKANEENRIVITKEADFLDSFMLYGKPAKLLLVKTGNLTNIDLLKLFHENLNVISNAFEKYSFLELTRSEIITHK